ncbi:hypothetical protein [Paraflavitalea pollutisoli]|uniref:hypothetical protein n=1 Tax=Paraflavitalea pollutisoli TaxID=3034143 RepID=UPI0023EB1AF2|nr:hypothetical protein [Paraflavitalea sp. H1-2-19X]
MSATDHTKHYSAADIQRYLAGELSPAEMHALELAALDDPFLADAIEGMQLTIAQQSKAPIDTHLQELHQRLQERVAGEDRRQVAPVIAFRWWQAAAAAAVVIIGGIWYFNSTSDSRTHLQPVAAVEKTKDVNPESVAPQSFMADSSVATNQVLTDSLLPPGMLAKETESSAGITSQKSGYAISENALENNASKKAITPPAMAYSPLPKPSKSQTEAKILTQENQLVAAEKSEQPAAILNKQTYQPTMEDSMRLAFAPKKALSSRNQANLSNTAISSNATRPGDFEQIIVGKTPRDTSAAGFLSKPREREMNLSRRELSARQAKKNPDALLSGFVSGRVTDNATNSPISNALLRIDGKRDYFTDNKGWFKIPTNDSVVNVAVGTSGYYTQNLQLNNHSSNLISLNQLGDKAPNPQLNFNGLQGKVAGVQVEREFAGDSAAVASFKNTFHNDSTGDYRTKLASRKKEMQIGYGYAFDKQAESAAQRSSSLKMTNAEPEYGWLKYQQYLDQNKRLPENGTAGAGKVVVAFEVDKKGVPANFLAISSPGQAYSDEAVRLIKAGPSWKLLKGRKAKVTVVVTF